MIRKIAAAICLAGMLSAPAKGAEPTLDVSSPEAFKASVVAISATLPDDVQRHRFNNSWFKLQLGSGPTIEGTLDKLRPYQGMTAAQIIEAAETQ